MVIVTAGAEFIDIDAYAGCIAYAELLRKQGIEAQAVGKAPLNASITNTVHSWKVDFAINYQPNTKDSFVLIDISNPEFFADFVDLDKVSEVIDHHSGFEEYWRQRIGSKANIEFIGAACTLVYEQWAKANMLGQISETSARLLITGILDNTLNLKASLTHQRDKYAYRSLLPMANLPKDWPTRYFNDCQAQIAADLPKAISNDYKLLKPGPNMPRILAQLVVWGEDSKDFMEAHLAEIQSTLDPVTKDWCMNLISISDSRSYLLCVNP